LLEEFWVRLLLGRVADDEVVSQTVEDGFGVVTPAGELVVCVWLAVLTEAKRSLFLVSLIFDVLVLSIINLSSKCFSFHTLPFSALPLTSNKYLVNNYCGGM
jgi:hypothetical protein